MIDNIYKGFECFNDKSEFLEYKKKQLSYQKRHVDSFNQRLSYKIRELLF